MNKRLLMLFAFIFACFAPFVCAMDEPQDEPTEMKRPTTPEDKVLWHGKQKTPGAPVKKKKPRGRQDFWRRFYNGDVLKNPLNNCSAQEQEENNDWLDKIQ